MKGSLMDFQVINPFSQKVVDQYNFDKKTQIDRCFNLLNSSDLKSVPRVKRASNLRKVAKLIERDSEQLINQIIKEIGKTRKDAILEVNRCPMTINACCDALSTLSGDLLYSESYLQGDGRWGVVDRHPLGILLAITPFNFPLNLALHKIAPALAMGNRVLLKPHPQCRKSALMLAELFYEAGFKQEDIQVLVIRDEIMGDLIGHEHVHAISFTGSYPVARKIASVAGMRKQLYELGGNDALIVMNDGNVSKAVDQTIAQRFGCSGQRCTAPKRVYVHESQYAEYRHQLLQKMDSLKMGDPELDSTDVGPLVSVEAAKKVEDQLELIKKEGGVITRGGKREGAIIHPTIVEELPDNAEVLAQEIFGPVVILKMFKTTSQLISEVNSSPYGLQCGVFTESLADAKKLFSSIDVGSLVLNDGPGFRADHFPFGGVKLSGVGREGARYALEEMSVTKTLVW